MKLRLYVCSVSSSTAFVQVCIIVSVQERAEIMEDDALDDTSKALLLNPLKNVVNGKMTLRSRSELNARAAPQFSVACRTFSDLRAAYQIHVESVVAVNLDALTEWHFMRPVYVKSEKYQELIQSLKVASFVVCSLTP